MSRFPHRSGWGRGGAWWRQSWGPRWYVRYSWWPGFGYYAGACFAADDDGYLFSGRNRHRALDNCDEYSDAGGCVFVGCD